MHDAAYGMMTWIYLAPRVPNVRLRNLGIGNARAKSPSTKSSQIPDYGPVFFIGGIKEAKQS